MHVQNVDVTNFLDSLQAQMLASTRNMMADSATGTIEGVSNHAVTSTVGQSSATAAFAAHPMIQQMLNMYAATHATISEKPHDKGNVDNFTGAMADGLPSSSLRGAARVDPSSTPASASLCSPPRAVRASPASIGAIPSPSQDATVNDIPSPVRNTTSGGSLQHTPPSHDRGSTSSPSDLGRGASSSRVPLSTANVSVLTPAPVAFTVSAGGGSPSHRRNFMRRQRTEYIRNQRGQGGPGLKTHIPTDQSGNVIALKSVLNRAIRDIAGRTLDVSVKEFNHHPAMAFQLIEADIHNQFTFDPPLKGGYIKTYLQDALSWTRYQWRSYWRKNQARHPQCPVKRYPALVAQWTSEAAQLESERMRNAWEQRGTAAGNGGAGPSRSVQQDPIARQRVAAVEEVMSMLHLTCSTG